jgi:hypothetical protein
MTRLQFNMKLNALVTDFLEEGGDPSWIAEDLRQVADEVFEEPEDEVLDQVAGPFGQEMK